MNVDFRPTSGLRLARGNALPIAKFSRCPSQRATPIGPSFIPFAPRSWGPFFHMSSEMKGAANWGGLSSSLAASLVRRPPSQCQPRATRPCGPSGRPLAGSIRTQPAGPLLFWPFAAALLQPLDRRRYNAARLFIPSKSPWDESETGLRSGALYKNVHRDKKASAPGLAPN